MGKKGKRDGSIICGQINPGGKFLSGFIGEFEFFELHRYSLEFVLMVI
jgi:hypothetical protein